LDAVALEDLPAVDLRCAEEPERAEEREAMGFEPVS
jgi:hypothetical protein